jgi:hypothetical protein
MIGADGLENVPHREWLLIFDRVLNDVKAEMNSRGREDEFFGARVSCGMNWFSQLTPACLTR